MVEINYIKAQVVPIHPDNLNLLPEEQFERLNEYTAISKEGVRVILASREPSEEEIMENWVKFKELKAQDGGA